MLRLNAQTRLEKTFMNLTLGIVTSAALLDSINPCAISVLLLTVGFLLNLGRSKTEVLKIGLLYVAAIYLTYLLIGLGVLHALAIFGVPNMLAKVGAIILIMTALINLAGYLIPNFPIKLKIPAKSHNILAKYINEASYTSAFVLGVLVGLFEFPCTGGPYLSILSLLHDRASFGQGLAYLLYYNLIFVAPLIIVLLLTNSTIAVHQLEKWRKQYTKRVDIVASLLMLALAVVILATAI